ncbi:MAG TPA: adenylate/guanylate cyclase domain-containing protein [Nitrososphaerales archaeon]
MTEGERRLAAIMFTDIVGYTAMAQTNESRALALLKEHKELIRPIFALHGGREVKTMGDAFLVEFASALAATNCAIDLESALLKFNEGKKDKVRVRVGIHVGDVVHEEGDVYGDAVNIASRIEPLAEGGGVCISQQAYDQVRNKVPFRFTRLGARELSNVSVPIEVYRLESTEKIAEESSVESGARQRLAVLPFANLSPDQSDEYLSDGMTEELISTLSKVPEIQVISRTSVMQYKKSPKPIKEVSRELRVGTVLEGSVRKAAGKLRVTVQMIDAERDVHLWAESYDRDLNDVFAIQIDIARLVVDALRPKLLPGVSAKLEEVPSADPGAYNLYLEGRYHWNKRELEDVKQALVCFSAAVKEDPGFALGYVGLGDCYQVLTTRFGLDVDENRGRAKAMFAKALELDPDLAEVHASRGVTLLSDYDMRAAEGEFRRAIELKPSYASAHQWYAQLLIAQLRWDEGLLHIEKAAELDPFSQIICLVRTFFYEARRDYGTGLEFARRAAELNPRDGGSHFELAWLFGKMKLFDDMRREAEIGVRLVRDSYPHAEVGAKAMLGYLEDDKETIRDVLPKLKEHLGGTFTANRFISDLSFYLEDADAGFEWLERSLSEKEFDLIFIKSNESLDGVRTDPRYLSLLERLGLA